MHPECPLAEIRTVKRLEADVAATVNGFSNHTLRKTDKKVLVVYVSLDI